MEKLLSVIVPVYNVEKTLERCLESIVNQTYKNLEIILVDDGSTDSSRKICEEWCSKDNRIVLLPEKENEGLAETRNVGMKASRGNYIAFVDSDDFLDVRAFEQMIKALQNDESDMVICNYWDYAESANIKKCAYKLKAGCWNSKKVAEKMFCEKVPMSVCCRIVKREVLMPSNGMDLWFPRGRRYEDTVVSFKQVLRSGKVSIIAMPLYYYVQNENSITSVPVESDVLDIIKNVIELQKFVNKGVTESLIACYACSSLVYALQLYYRCPNKDREVKIKLLKEIAEETDKITVKSIFKSASWKKIFVCKIKAIDVVISHMYG